MTRWYTSAVSCFLVQGALWSSIYAHEIWTNQYVQSQDLHLTDGLPYKYSLTLEKAPKPAMSTLNPRGKGWTPCNYTFNPAWVVHEKRSAIFVRTALCPEEYGGATDHIMMAFCEDDGVCGDLEPLNFPWEEQAEDPRVVFDSSSGYYYLWYYATAGGNPQSLSTVFTRRSKTPFVPSTWELVTEFPLPWHRNVCALPPDAFSDRKYVLFGESPPMAGIGIAVSYNDYEIFNTLNSELMTHRAGEQVIEASTPLVRLSTGDFLHLYSAGTDGWNKTGIYAAGWLVLNGSDPTKVVQTSKEYILVPTEDFEGVPPLHDYQVQNHHCTFVTSIVPIQGQTDTFRLWWGAADASVATGILKVHISGGDQVKSGVNGWVIVGVVVLVIMCLLCIGILFFAWKRIRGIREQRLNRDENAVSMQEPE